ncbi:protein phosphatase 1 regulatory inhibitor subunit PPP1R7 homolog [Neltuma alba]|uniref:protein phosphatase 1 regulatory inhibitor subunit PPP1R7 homolog n=1 Tax=Neltuma alba TaxID=207710 RepID=UPI0010A4AC0E|nr:protein phosphatase 1 regulatory inhibitor subunit PPP1R7 homolog [Prosopis alba]
MEPNLLRLVIPMFRIPAEVEEDPSSTLLDLTGCQLHDLDSVDLPPYLTELDLTTNRLSALDPRIAHLSNLKKLSLRQNLLTDAAVEPLSARHDIAGLEVIQVMLLPPIAFCLLERFGKIGPCVLYAFPKRNMELCRTVGSPKALHVPRNEVMKMEETDHFHELQILELGSNKLRMPLCAGVHDILGGSMIVCPAEKWAVTLLAVASNVALLGF